MYSNTTQERICRSVLFEVSQCNETVLSFKIQNDLCMNHDVVREFHHAMKHDVLLSNLANSHCYEIDFGSTGQYVYIDV